MSDQEWPSAPGSGSGSGSGDGGDQGSPPPGSPPPGSTPPGGAPPPPPEGTPPPAPSGPAGAPQGPGGQAAGDADLTKRFLARLIDWVGLFIVYAILWAVIVAAIIADAASGGGMAASPFGGFSIIGLLISLIPAAYFIGMLAFNDGKTIGKAILGLQVRRADGSPLDVGAAFQREWWNLLLIIPFIGGLATAGMAIFIAVTINNGAPWHDQQAGTIEYATK